MDNKSKKNLGNESLCNNKFITLEPVYLSIRKDTLNHSGIGDPADPTNYSLISTKIFGFCNDINNPFSRVFTKIVEVPIIVKSPCGDVGEDISTVAQLEECTVVSASNFAPILYGVGNIGLLAGTQKFIGIEQVVDYYSPGTKSYSNEDFDLDFNLIPGTPPNGNIGYEVIVFSPDDPVNDPKGPGAYFFKIVPKVRIIKHDKTI